MKPAAFLFDLDGTLVDTEALMRARYSSYVTGAELVLKTRATGEGEAEWDASEPTARS